MSARPTPLPRNHFRGIAVFFAHAPTISALRQDDNRPLQKIIRRTLISLAVAQLFLPWSGPAYAEPDACSLQTPSSVVCSGNQSGGIATGRTLLTNGSTL